MSSVDEKQEETCVFLYENQKEAVAFVRAEVRGKKHRKVLKGCKFRFP